ncbi:Acg family FMN-binding oxidoreductase [Actinomadura alba]|uniref:Nitroreductase domain-containing protein n=1 Tax=Actinomadura alba TaxID=406431 RepID=A0ABR7M121_9ACTN|nr:hypothetical protein [Actinomadura alba]MBC6470504.1 hypothetical protein [Actinomadura alba]
MNTTDALERQKIVRSLVDAAVWAPSVHNTQPWWFETRDLTVMLHADTDRRLDVADPDGREMFISCGAALYTLRLAVRQLGHVPLVRTFADPERPALVAEVSVGPPQPALEEESRAYAQIRRRRTHRGGFSSARLPVGLPRRLGVVASNEGSALRVVTDSGTRTALAALTKAAEQIQRQSPDYVAELARWSPPPGRLRSDGVRDDAYPREPEQIGPDFATRDYARGKGWGRPGGGAGRAVGVVALLVTREDTRADWLRCGQALQCVLLRAAEANVSAAFHTQALEVPELREFIRSRFCGGAHPQMIMRLGVAGGMPGGGMPGGVRRSSADVIRREL